MQRKGGQTLYSDGAGVDFIEEIKQEEPGQETETVAVPEERAVS